MNDINTVKAKFIEKCNKVALGKTIDEEQIYPDNVYYISFYILGDIFDICEFGTSKALDNKIFEAVTQENVLKSIEKGILEIFERDLSMLPIISCVYVSNATLRSGLQFLVDYAENNEINENIKKRLQTILTHKNTIDMTEILYEFKKRLLDLDYLNSYQKDLTNIPLSHDWWKRD